MENTTCPKCGSGLHSDGTDGGAPGTAIIFLYCPNEECDYEDNNTYTSDDFPGALSSMIANHRPSKYKK